MTQTVLRTAVATDAMRRGRLSALAFLVLVVSGLAGCSEAPEGVPADTIDHSAPEVQVGTDTGAIQGVVVDETIAPVGGAQVALPQLDRTATTNEEGGFGFSDVAPGIYVVDAASPDHLGARQSIEVVAGEVSKVRVLLEIDPTPSPYHQVRYFEGYVGLWAPPGSYVVQLLVQNDTICRCEWTFQTPDAVTEFIYEALWTQTIVVPTLDQMYWELDSYVDGSLDHQEGDYSQSPVYVRLDRATYPPEADTWLARITPATTGGVFVQQSYELFITSFHFGPGPDEYSIVEGDV